MIRYSYLPEQFSDAGEILAKIAAVVARGDFTLGAETQSFEEAVARRCAVKHAIGVNSGTDALFLSLKALRIGGQVITTPYSFFATTAAIVHAGAQPVYADVGEDFNIDPRAIEAAITPSTEAIMPVHWAGRPCDMAAINGIADRHGLAVIEDAAHAFGAQLHGEPCGSWGTVGTFSLHPLKTLNVWGDGGLIVTDSDFVAGRLRKLRNHGLIDRDRCVQWGYNSRLDTIQAVVGHHVLEKIDGIVDCRRTIAARLDRLLDKIDGIAWEAMPKEADPTYYLYTFRAERRDALVEMLVRQGVDAKIHYPVPLHLQIPAAGLGYREGDFPIAERLAKETVSLPAHEFVTEKELGFMAALIRDFFSRRIETDVSDDRRAAI